MTSNDLLDILRRAVNEEEVLDLISKVEALPERRG
jgi:hypothetical protein